MAGRQFTEVVDRARFTKGAGQSLERLTVHEGHLTEIYSQGASDILNAANTSDPDEVYSALKRTGQKWEVSVAPLAR